MGMFDDISQVPPQNCLGCGEPLGRWQSKDGECVLATVPFWTVGTFYTSCDNCHMWHQFNERELLLKPVRPLSDYKLSVRGALGGPLIEVEQ